MKRVYEIKLHEQGTHTGYYVVTIDGKYASRHKVEADAKRSVELRKYYNKEITVYPTKEV